MRIAYKILIVKVEGSRAVERTTGCKWEGAIELHLKVGV
jgi:hypothetical protein